MRKSTRLIALLMTLMMLVGMMPFSTFAVPSSDDHDHDHGDGETYLGESVSSSELSDVQKKVTAAGGTLVRFQNFEGLLAAGKNFELLADNEGGLSIDSLNGGTFGTWKSWAKAMAYERKDGNVALKLFNSTATAPAEKGIDTFLTVNASEVKGKNFVLSFDYKQTGGTTNGQEITVQFGARYNGFQAINLIKFTKNGEIKSVLTGDKVLGYVNSEVFTTIAVRCDISANKAYFYVNGVLAGEATLYTEAWLGTCTTKNSGGEVTKDNINLEAFRMFQTKANLFPTDGIYVDNVLLYTSDSGKTLKYIDEDTDPVTGFYQADGKIYYISNNNRLASTTVAINGVKYGFDVSGAALKAERISLVNFDDFLKATNDQWNNPTTNVVKEKNGLYALKSTKLSGPLFGSGAGIASVTLQDFFDADRIEWNVYTDGIQSNTVLPLYFDFNTTYTYNPNLKEGDEGYNVQRPLNVVRTLNFDSKNVVCYGGVTKDPDTQKEVHSYNVKHTYDDPKSVNGWTVIDMSIGFDSMRLGWTNTNLATAGKTASDVALGDIFVRTGDTWGIGDGKTYANTIYDENGNQIVNNDYCIYFTSINLVKYTTPATSIAELGATGWVEINGAKYYFTPWDHTLATGTIDIDGVGYTFDNNGKLVGKANGIQTVQFGKVHYYKDGVAQVGNSSDFKYTDPDTNIVYAINPNGDYLGNYSAYAFAKDYATIDYSGVTNAIKAINFNDIALGKYFKDNAYAYSSGQVASNYVAEGLRANVKYTYSEIVKDADGDNAILWSNKTTSLDPYLELMLGGTDKKNIALSFDVKLGEDWSGYLNLIQLVTRMAESGNVNTQNFFSNVLNINSAGYLTFINDNYIVAKLSASEYTNITLACRLDDTNGYVDLYINGAKVVENAIFWTSNDKVSKFPYFNEIRFARFDQSVSKQISHIYFDDIYAYALGENEVPVTADTTWTYTGPTGLTEVDGIWYNIAENGVRTRGKLTKDGTDYYFDLLSGAGVTGVVDGALYNGGKKVTATEAGVTVVGGNSYYVKEDNTLLVDDSLCDGGVRYVADKNGVVTIETISGTDATFGAADIKNGNGGKLEYNKYGSEYVYTTTGNFVMKKNSKINLSNTDVIRVKMYIPEAFTDSKVMFILQREDLLYELSGDLGNDFTSVSSTAVYKSVAAKDAEYTDMGWKDFVIGGATKHIRLAKVTKADGTTTYYKRDYTYYAPTSVVQLKDLGNGWVTLDIPMSIYALNGDKGPMTLADVSEICYITSWGSGDNKMCYIGEADKNKTISVESVSFVSYEEKNTENNGIKNDYYYDNGVLKTGWQNIGGDYYYFDPITGKKLTGVRYISTKRPTATGIALFSSEDNGAWYDFGSNGICNGEANGVKSVTVPVVNGNNVENKTVLRLFTKGELNTSTGFVTGSDGKQYYVSDSNTGALYSNVTTRINGELYTFDSNGVAGEFDGWYTEGDDTYYSDKINGLASGLTLIDGTYYYFDTTTNALKKNHWVDGMYFGADGKAAEGMLENVVKDNVNEGKMYFKNGVPSAGTVEKDGFRYTFGNDGKLVENETIDLTAAKVAITIFKDTNKQTLKFDVKKGESFTYTVPNYIDYNVKAYDADGNEIEADENGVITISVDAVNAYLEFTIKYEPSGDHEWIYHEELSTPATCMYGGTKVYVCEDCGKTKSEPTPIDTEMGHKFTEFDGTYCNDPNCDHKNGCWRIGSSATCTEDGVRYTYCTECNKKIKYETIQKGHDWDMKKPVKVIVTPVCNEEGLGEFKCKNCTETILMAFTSTEYHTQPKFVKNLKDPTCISEGVAQYTCEACGDTWTEVIAADPSNGHAWKQDQKLSDATCYTKAEKWTYYCTLCGERKEEDVKIDEKNWIHDYDEGVRTEPTCGKDGKIVYTCKNPDCEKTKEEIIPATGNHVFVTDKYVTDSEHHWNKCENCDAQYGYEQHEFTWTEEFDNDGKSIGHKGTCKCGYTTSVEDHVLVKDGDNNKIFMDEDSHWNECSVCGAKVNKVSHTFESKKDETQHWEECTVCGYIKNKAEHDYSEWARDDAQHWKVCSCGATTEKADHAFSDDYTTDDSKHWHECECGLKKDEADHSFEDKYDETKHWKECSVCHKIKDETNHTVANKYDKDYHWTECEGCKYVSEKVAHKKVKITDAIEPTCTHGGNSEGLKCEDCGYVFVPVEYYGQLDHDVIDTWVSDANGHYHACRNCATKLDYTAHIFPDEFEVNDKEHKKVCTVCGARSSDSGAHVYPEDQYINLDDEAGTATGVCKDCGHTTDKTIETWYAKLGMIKVDGKYYYPVEGENVKNMFVQFEDGLRYFDSDGALVLTYTASGIYSMTFKKSKDINNEDCDRGVIDNAVISCGGLLVDGHGEGTYYVENGAIKPNQFVMINKNAYYFGEYGIMVTNTYLDVDNDGVNEYWFGEDGKGYKLVAKKEDDVTE